MQDELYDPAEQRAIQQAMQRQMSKSSVTDPFRSFDSGAKKGGLGDMFATPDDITFKGSFDEAAQAAEASGKRACCCPESLPYPRRCPGAAAHSLRACSADGQHPGRGRVCIAPAEPRYLGQQHGQRYREGTGPVLCLLAPPVHSL